jgi:hypothetical protein
MSDGKVIAPVRAMQRAPWHPTAIRQDGKNATGRHRQVMSQRDSNDGEMDFSLGNGSPKEFFKRRRCDEEE